MKAGMWHDCTLGEVVTLKRGYDLPHDQRVPGPFPIISSSGATGYHAVAKVRGPGVVTGRYGTLGQVFYSAEDFWPLNTSLYVRDFKGNDPKFIAYFMQSLDFGSRNAAGAVPGVNRNHLHLMRVRVPTPDLQRRIAAILSGYDASIENNVRRIQILEQMARALYREWFVEFRFPGHNVARVVTSEHGRAPEGWSLKRLPECVEVDPRVVVSREGAKPFVPMGSLATDSMIITGIESRTNSSGSKFQNGDTLFARITPCLENGKTAFVQFLADADAVACGSTEFIVLRSRILTPEFVYLLARSDAFRDNAIKSMSGATGRQRVRAECFDRYMVAVPPRGLLDHFSSVVNPAFRLIQVLHLQNENLRRTRDLLLPRLMSGELTLDEAAA